MAFAQALSVLAMEKASSICSHQIHGNKEAGIYVLCEGNPAVRYV